MIQTFCEFLLLKLISVLFPTPALQKGVPEQLYEGCIYNVTNHMNQLVKDGRAKEERVQEKMVYRRTAVD